MENILHHCRCFKGNENKNDGECSPSLQMLGKNGNLMDGKCSSSLEMLKWVVAYPIPMGAPALPGAPIHGAPENIVLISNKKGSGALENTVLISNKKGSESPWTHVGTLKRTPHVPSTGYSLIHSWWESNPGGCVQET
jgi:hypothetical protein